MYKMIETVTLGDEAKSLAAHINVYDPNKGIFGYIVSEYTGGEEGERFNFATLDEAMRAFAETYPVSGQTTNHQ